MVDKNPYENGVDIPDFVESKDEDVDLSVFKMSDDELNTSSNNIQDDEVEDDEFDEDDDEPKRKLSPKGVVVIGAVALVVLLIAAVVGWVYGAKQHAAYVAAAAQVETLNGNVETLNATITDLQNQITALQEAQTTTTTTESGDGTKYTVITGMNVRKAASTSADYASASSVSGITGVITNDNVVQLTSGTTVTVYETTTDGNKTWGRIGTDAWICLVNGSDTYAKVAE